MFKINLLLILLLYLIKINGEEWDNSIDRKKYELKNRFRNLNCKELKKSDQYLTTDEKASVLELIDKIGHKLSKVDCYNISKGYKENTIARVDYFCNQNLGLHNGGHRCIDCIADYRWYFWDSCELKFKFGLIGIEEECELRYKIINKRK